MTQTKIHHRQSYVDGGLPGNWKTLGCVPKTILAVGRLVGTRVGGAFHENFLQKTSAGKRQAKSAKTRRVDESTRRFFGDIRDVWDKLLQLNNSPSFKFHRHVMVVCWTSLDPIEIGHNCGIDTPTEG